MSTDNSPMSSLTSLIVKLRDLKVNANKWSLADDRQLRFLLNEVDESLRTSTDDTLSRLKSNDSAMTSLLVQIENLNNRLSSFSAHHFIENRVAEDVLSSDAVPEHLAVINTANKREEAIENLRSAASSGLELMRTHFRRIDMRAEDFDEDDDPTFMPEPVFEPIDENLARSLPCVIGSNEWLSSLSTGTSNHPVEKKNRFNAVEEVVINFPPPATTSLPSTASTCSTVSLKNDEASASRQFPPVSQKAESRQIAIPDSASDDTTQLTEDSHLSLDPKDLEEKILVNYNRGISPMNSTVDRKAIITDLEKLFNKSPDPGVRTVHKSTKQVILPEILQKSRGVDMPTTGSVGLFDDSSDDDTLFEESKTPRRPSALTSSTNVLRFPQSEYENSEAAKNPMNTTVNPEFGGRPKILPPVSQTKSALLTGLTSETDELERKREEIDHLKKQTVKRTLNTDSDWKTETLPSLLKKRARGPSRRLPTRRLDTQNESNAQTAATSVGARADLTSSDAPRESVEEKSNLLSSVPVTAAVIPFAGIQDKVNGITSRSPPDHPEKTVSNEQPRMTVKSKSESVFIKKVEKIEETTNESRRFACENSLFASSSDDDIFSSSNARTTDDKKTMNIQKKSAPSDISTSSSLVESLSKYVVESPITVNSTTMTKSKQSSLVKTLFDSDSEDDLFITKKVSRHVQNDKSDLVRKEKHPYVTTNKSLVTEKIIPKHIDIFGDDDSGDDLFQ